MVESVNTVRKSRNFLPNIPTPDGPLTYLDEADLDHILGKFASWGSGVKLGDRADNPKAEVE